MSKFKDIDDIHILSLDSMCKKLEDFHNIFTSLKNLRTQKKKKKKELKNKVLHDAGDLYNNLYHSYKDKYNGEINSLDKENRKRLDYKKLKLTDDYQYPPEEQQEEETISDVNKFNEWVDKEETDIKTKLFKKHFKIQRPGDMLKYLYQTNDRKKTMN